MSLIERISKLNRINTLLMLQNDRMSRNANVPDQQVRKMLTSTENEILTKYERDFPETYEVETGAVDENGVPITKFRRFVLPDSEPDLEQEDEPDFIKNEAEIKNRLQTEYTRLTTANRLVVRGIHSLNTMKMVATDDRNMGKISDAEYCLYY